MLLKTRFFICALVHVMSSDLWRNPCRTDLPNAGLANITATSVNLLGYEAPSFYEASLVETK
jgi:hypothetical protein